MGFKKKKFQPFSSPEDSNVQSLKELKKELQLLSL